MGHVWRAWAPKGDEMTRTRQFEANPKMQNVPPIGSTLLDRYYVEEILDDSGDTAILKCVDTRLDVHDVVKFLIGDDEASTWGAKRQGFIQSFRAVARLNHPNIVHVANIETRCGLTFSVMELLQGPTLATFLNEGAYFEPKEALELFLGVIDAIAMAHSLDTLHKRISPSQIILNCQGARLSPRILNFMSSKNTADLNIETAIPFLAPEQYRNFDNATQASDIFALCATMYCVFAHEPPLRLSSIEEFSTFYEQCSGIDWFPASVPPEFVPILSAGLRTRPEERQWDALSLLKAVKKIGANFKLSANLSIDASRKNFDDHPALSSISSVIYHSGKTGSSPSAQRSGQLSAVSNSQPVVHATMGSKSQPIVRSGSGSISQPIVHAGTGSVSQPVQHLGTGSVSQSIAQVADGAKQQPSVLSSKPGLPKLPIKSMSGAKDSSGTTQSGMNASLNRGVQLMQSIQAPQSGMYASVNGNHTIAPSAQPIPSTEIVEDQVRALPQDALVAPPSVDVADPAVQAVESSECVAERPIAEAERRDDDVDSCESQTADRCRGSVVLPGELASIYKVHHMIREHARGFVACVSTTSNGSELYCLKCFYAHNSIEKAVFNEGVRRSDLLAQKSPYIQGIFQAYPDECAFLADNVMCQPLPESIAQNGAYEPAVVAQIGILLAEAMDIAHQSGYINGNIKPSNIVFENRSGVMTPVIYDFGQSLYVDSIDHIHASDVAFIAPELKYNLQQSNAQSDIFAFGMSLVYMLLGKVPYDGIDEEKSTNVDVAKIIEQYEDVPDLTQIAPNIPKDLCQVIRWCTSFDVASRYVRFCDVVRDLRVVYQQLVTA